MRNRFEIGNAYKQGEFDGLCGLYSLLNAVGILFPETPYDLHKLYFSRMISHIGRSMSANTIVKGMGPRQMWSMVLRMRTLVRSIQAMDLMVEWTKAESAMEAWEILRDNVSRDSVAIIGLSGAVEHWTVVTDINRRYARFLDSGSLTGVSVDRLRRRGRAGGDIEIDANAIFVISR